MAVGISIEENIPSDFSRGWPYKESYIRILKQTAKHSCKDCGICCLNLKLDGKWIEVEKGHYYYGSNGSRPIFYEALDLVANVDVGGGMCPLLTADGCLVHEGKFRLCKLFYCDTAVNSASDIHYDIIFNMAK